VLVPVGSAAAVRRTAGIATLLASAHGGSVVFVAVRSLSYDIALRADRIPDWLVEAVAALDANGAEIRILARLGQSVVGAIEATARELEAQALLLHWESGELTIPRAERNAFTRLFTQPPCTALLLRGRFHPEGLPSILLAADRGPSLETALDTADAILAGAGGGSLHVLRVIAHDADDAELERQTAVAAESLELLPAGVTGEALALRGRSREGTVLDALADRPVDLAIVAAPRQGVIRRLGRTALPRRLLLPSASPVLIVNRPEARPLSLFHRIWEPLYHRLPTLSEEEKIATYMKLRRAARADVDYHVLMLLAAAVATLGLLLDSAAVVIGAMLLAPLMSPIAGVALGVVQGDAKLLRISLGSIGSGTATAIAIALLVTFFVPGAESTGEIAARTQPGLLDLLVALGSGIAAAYTLSRPGLSAALPGVAVAAALVPPLAAASVGVVLGEWQDAAGAALLFGTNLVAIAAASAVTFLWIGFRPDADRADRFGVFGRGVVGLAILLVAVALPLAGLSVRAFQHDQRTARAERTLDTATLALPGVELATVDVSTDVEGNGVTVRARLLAEEPLSHDQVEALRIALETELNTAVHLEVELTQLIRAGP